MARPDREGINLLHGDCLELMKDIPDASIDMILCDLPYGTTVCKWDSVIPFEPLWEQYERIIKDNGVIVLTASQPFTSALVMSNPKLFKYEWIWEKTKTANFMHLKRQPGKRHESVLVFYKKQPAYNPQMRAGKPYIDKRKSRKQSKGTYGNINIENTEITNTGTRYPKSVILFSNGKSGKLHPTQKPVELMEYLIKTYTNEGDTVLDNTMGSGTTGVACVNTNRNFIGIELDDEYFEIAKQRISEAQNKHEQITMW